MSDSNIASPILFCLLLEWYIFNNLNIFELFVQFVNWKCMSCRKELIGASYFSSSLILLFLIIYLFIYNIIFYIFKTCHFTISTLYSMYWPPFSLFFSSCLKKACVKICFVYLLFLEKQSSSFNIFIYLSISLLIYFWE